MWINIWRAVCIPKNFLYKHRYEIYALIVYVAIALVVFRFNFGTVSDFPKGTNALDSYMSIYELKKYGLSTWTPLTDWGLQNPIMLSPLIPFEYIFPATPFIRSFEFVSFLLAGVSMYFLSKKFVKNEPAAILSGLFYTIAVETSQFFEGHVFLIFSFAIFPLAFLSIYDIIKRPNLRGAIILALVFYLLFNVGDLGMFYMIVVVSLFELIFLETRNIIRKTWRFEHVKFITLAVLLFLVVNAAWIFQYLAGNRPQFTTNVTTVIAPFSQVSGQPIYYSFVGFIADNSYTYFTLHNFEYSFIHGYYYLIFLILPALIFTYVTARRNKMLILLAVSAIPAIIISTANLYPGLTFFNEFLYFHFPLFNYIPALFRWNFYTDFVYAFVLAYILKDTFNITSNKSIGWNWKINLPRNKTLKRVFSKTNIRKIAVIVIILIFVFVTFSQNSEIFTEPPGTFSFPVRFTAGYSNLSQDPASNVLTIPFGAIYSRTNYGGVSQSTEFMSPYFSEHNSLMFQAGNPYSLQMDYFVGNGITFGFTNNITKFLSAANTGYVVTTKYGNWSQSSDAIYNPPINYDGYQQQYDKGTVIYSGLNQTTYRLSNSGQVYFAPSYYVYFGGSKLLYDVLNEPWYNGSSTPLINGSLLPSSQADQIISHASGIIISPATASEVSKYVPMTSGVGVPVIEIMDYSDFYKNTISSVYKPWNASNAYAFNIINGGLALPNSSFFTYLESHGYDCVNVSARAQIGHIFSISFSADKQHLYRNMTTSFSDSASIPWTNISVVTDGINNQGLYPYNGTVKLQTTRNGNELLWNFTPNNNTFQHLNFAYGNILNSNYLHFVQEGKSEGNYVFQAILSTGHALFSSPPINSINLYNSTDNATNVYFNLYNLNQYAESLGKNVSVERFVVGFPNTGNYSNAILRDFELFNVPDKKNGGFQNINFGNVSLKGDPISMYINATANVLFNTVSLTFTSANSIANSLGYAKIPYSSSSPDQYFFIMNTTSPGILVFSQTYSNQWNLSGIKGDHVVVNIGLNGWFIDPQGNSKIAASITFSGLTYLYHGIIIEIILSAAYAGLIAMVEVRRRRR